MLPFVFFTFLDLEMPMFDFCMGEDEIGEMRSIRMEEEQARPVHGKTTFVCFELLQDNELPAKADEENTENLITLQHSFVPQLFQKAMHRTDHSTSNSPSYSYFMPELTQLPRTHSNNTADVRFLDEMPSLRIDKNNAWGMVPQYSYPQPEQEITEAALFAIHPDFRRYQRLSSFSPDSLKSIPSSPVGTPWNSIPVHQSEHGGNSFEESCDWIQILQSDAILHLHANESTFREIFTQMNKRLSSSTDQSKTCEAVTNFASRNDVNKIMIARTGGIEAIINAMRNHAEVSSVQLAACRALQHLAKCHNLHEKITAAGGIECLIASLKYHGDNHSIQVAACSALATLAANAENAISAEHKDFTKVNTARRIASAGGIKLILSTMRHHKRSETDVKSSNAELSLRQTSACWALHYLSVIRKNKEKIVALGGLECIMNSLRFGLQRIEHASVSRALARTTLSEPPSDELDETCAALEAGCMALWGISDEPDNHIKVVSANGIACVISVLKAANEKLSEAAQASVMTLQRAACKTLYTLADDHAARIAAQECTHEKKSPEEQQKYRDAVTAHKCIIVEKGGINHIVGALQMHAKFKPLNNAERKTLTALYVEAFSALRLLAVLPKSAYAIAEAGGLGAITTAMRVQRENSELQIAACRFLVFLANCAEDQFQFLAEYYQGVSECCVATISFHYSNQQVQEAATQLLSLGEDLEREKERERERTSLY